MSERDILSKSNRAYELIIAARESAMSRFGNHSIGGSWLLRPERLAILVEEIGEVAEHVTRDRRQTLPTAEERERHDAPNRDELIDELAQVSAAALMWIEAELAIADALEMKLYCLASILSRGIPHEEYSCELLKGHDGSHRDGVSEWTQG